MTSDPRLSTSLLDPADPELLAALRQVVPGGVRARATDRLALAHDASHYLLTPTAVVTPRDASQVAALLRFGAERHVPLTFRSGGTSLSGQAVTEHLLVDTRRHFRAVEVLDGGARVRVQPGATLRQVNAHLAPYGRRLGPDPASESACTIGGVVANNSSGMTCGTELNAYRTLHSMVLVLASGTVLDTGAPDADERLRALEPVLHAGLLRLRDQVRADPDSVRRIQAQYAMKNTMGYGLNALLDHDTPAEILAHLVVGSEGTLAFVAEATFRTVPVRPHAATGLLMFTDLHEAMAAMPTLVEAGPAAIELLDAESLRVAARDPLADATLTALTIIGHAALLVEWQQADAEELEHHVRAAEPALAGLPLVSPARLSADAAARSALWQIRKGLYAAVAGARPSGTTALLEDIAVPVADLADTCDALGELFDKHGYQGSVIFGHARDGNLHFMLNERFTSGARPERYAAFTEDMVDLVLDRGGTLKAEHGTGRVMAPYVRRQFGDVLYAVMREIKELCDPGGTLNPGVLVTDDPSAHLRDLKVVAAVEPEVDRCVECGYCEPVCPSRDLTTTPRQRIVLRRELAAATAAGDLVLAGQLADEYGYDAVDTCAVDGMCATACPVHINTGDLVKRLRAERQGAVAGAAWGFAARHWEGTTRVLGRVLDLARAVPVAAERGSQLGRAVLDEDTVPRWQRDLPAGGRRRRPVPAAAAQAVYVPSCLNTMFAPGGERTGGLGKTGGVEAALWTLAARAGVRLRVPEGVGSLCCATPWSSKGLPEGQAEMGGRVVRALREATRDGELPVVSDAASCTEGFARLVADAAEASGRGAGGAIGSGAGAIRVLDAVTFVAESLLPRLTVRSRLGSLALHPTCSSRRLGLDEDALRLARAVAAQVVVPVEWGCCGFAGDRGMLHPELTASATGPEAAELAGRTFDAYASLNRTCEIGMSRATGRPYQHLLEIVEWATR